jgi:hypothetical protein
LKFKNRQAWEAFEMSSNQEDQLISDLKQFFADPDSPALMQTIYADMPLEMQQWLGRLCLLYGLPFDYLVAHESMLPQESIRFFFIDHNWLDSLVDGVFSVGTHSSRNGALTQLMIKANRETTDLAMPQVRSRLRGVRPPSKVQAGATMTGFLLRSAVVAGWPGLEVKAYGQMDGSSPVESSLLQLLRMERLSADVLLCIYSGLPARVELNEPSESLHFGVEPGLDSPPGLSNGVIVPRWLGNSPDTPPAGTPVTDDESKWVAAVWRQQAGQNTRVLDIGKTRAALNQRLRELGAIASTQQIGPADFAIQMVKAPEQQAFENL